MFKSIVDNILNESTPKEELDALLNSEENTEKNVEVKSPEEELDALLNSEEPIEQVDDSEEVEEELEEREPMTTARVFSFDRVEINKQLELFGKSTVKEFPSETIKEILNGFELKIVRNGVEFETEDGDDDYELMTLDDKSITNSIMTIQWHKREDGNGYNFNCFIS